MYEINKHFEWYAKKCEAEWHRLRVHASILLSPKVKKGHTLRPEDLIRLPSDVKSSKMSHDRVKADMEAKTRIFLKRHKN